MYKYDRLSEPSPLILKSIDLSRSSCYVTTYYKIKKSTITAAAITPLTDPGPLSKVSRYLVESIQSRF